jgi:hypothetical protein
MTWIARVLGQMRGPSPPLDWWKADREFEFAGRKYQVYVSGHNCGWPPSRMTERSVELAIADCWLQDVDRVSLIEVGAVTPYYWPHRVPNVVDPYDPHPLVTIRESILDIDLSARPVLSISTFEHIGRGDYGLPQDPQLVLRSLEKLFAESPRFLVTVPRGFNATLDEYLLRLSPVQVDVQLHHLVRHSSGNDWRQEEDASKASLPYGFGKVRGGRAWANSVAIILRGPLGR